MTNTHQVIIEFVADTTSLASAIDTLAKMGKVDAELAAQFKKTNAEVKKQGDELTTAAKKSQTSTQSFGRLADLMKQFPRSGVNRYLLQMGSELSAAGIKAKDFYKNLDPKDTTTKIVTLKQELKNIKDQMQQAALAGGVLSEEYKKLKQRAGELDDTIKDVNSDIANAGSDTRGIDNIVGSISALAGGYSAVQGAAALFGEESEDLQRALLKVNAAMALATGIQQVSNALQKEGALARVADTIATGAQIAAQRLYTLVVGQSVGALKIFRIALASTGIGLLVIGLSALISNLSGAGSATKSLKKDLEDLRTATDNVTDAIKHQGEVTEAVLNNQGASQSEISRARLRNIEDINNAEQKGVNELEKKRDEIVKKNKELEKNGVSLRIGGIKQIDEALDISAKKQQDLFKESQLLRVKIEGEEKQERKKAAEDALAKAKELSEKQQKIADEARDKRLRGIVAVAKSELLATKEGSEAQLEAKKKLLGAELDLEVNNANLTIDEIFLAYDTFYDNLLQLDKDFQKEKNDRAAQAEIDLLNTSLLNRNLSNQNRLLAEEALIRKIAQIEIEAAKGNAEKIALIAARRDKDIADAKIASIQSTAENEIEDAANDAGRARRALEAVAANEKLKADIRINAINQLSTIELANIDRLINANREAIKIKGSDEEGLNRRHKKLLDDRRKAEEEAGKKITDLNEAENQKRIESDQKRINETLSALLEVGSILSEFQSNANQRLENEIKGRRKEIEDLLEAGAITEREARERNRRLDTEERNARIKAAQQQKALAIFNATITGAQAIMQAIASPPFFPANIATVTITSALVAAQIAAIASRPIPRFATGKKGSYKGLGEVGEAGAELIKRADGSMEVATRRSMVYLGSRDKVFTASETKNMLPYVNKEAIAASAKGFGEDFDYKRIEAALKKIESGKTVVNIDKEFISESVANGLYRINYFDRYYNSKG